MRKIFFTAAAMAVAVLAKAQAPENAPYQIKSGVVTMSMDMGGNEMITETYFDDYGLKTAQVSEGGFMGGSGKTRTITDKDGSQLSINDAAKTATRFPAGGMMGGNRNQVNWSNLTDKVIKNNRIKEVGKEEVAGKECIKYTMVVNMMGSFSNQTVWVYKGIVFKSSMSTNMGQFVQTCKQFEEKDVDASMFAIPEDLKIEDFDMSRFGGF